MANKIVGVLVLGFLVFIHELGHFLVAKAMKVKVEKFSIGFGPRICGFRKGDTEYILSLIPLGGYVKMLGEDPGDVSDPQDVGRSFVDKSAMAKIAIIAAGAAFNILLAWVVYSTAYYIGIPGVSAEIASVEANSPAQVAGIRSGDVVKKINGKKIQVWEEMVPIIASLPKKVEMTLDRGGKDVVVSLKLESREDVNEFGEKITVGHAGIISAEKKTLARFSVTDSATRGAKRTWATMEMVGKSVRKLVQRELPVKQLGGPVMIAKIAGDTYDKGIVVMLFFIGMLSANLAVMNLLPFPVVDGGQIVFTVIEGVIRRPLNKKFRQYTQAAGVCLLLVLMLVCLYNDIARLFLK